MRLYALWVHNLARRAFDALTRAAPRHRPPLAPERSPVVRRAQHVDIVQLCALVNEFVGEKLLLPRSAEQVAFELQNYVVAVDADGRVLACAALDEYSPSVAEVTSVAVDRQRQGRGLGSRVVLAAERTARQRGFDEVFAMSSADHFFLSLGYGVTPLAAYPEKLRRYELLAAAGVEIHAKRCFSKRIS